MARSSPLNVITIPIPCSVSWENMTGDEQVRYCSHCQQHVYNLSAMTREDAEQLLTDSTGRRCVRFYQRPDGKVITRNCSASHALRRVVGLTLGVVVGLFVLVFTWVGASDRGDELGSAEPLRTIMNWLGVPRRSVVMGGICPLPGPIAPGAGADEEMIEPPQEENEPR